MLNLLLQPFAAPIAFCEGFLQGLKEPQQRTTSHLEAAPQPPQLPPHEPTAPAEVEVIVISERVPMDYTRLVEFIDPMLGETSEPPQMSRADLVTALLDEAWTRGKSSYAELIDYVKQQSGTGCSRRAIARWKEARKLDSDQAQGQAA